MIIFLLGFLLLIAFVFDQKRFIPYLMLFFLLFDMFDGFYKDNKIFAAIRYALPLILVLIFIFKNKVLLVTDVVFLIFSTFLITLLILNPGDLMHSTKLTASLIITLSFLMIGRYLGQTSDFMKDFEPFNRIMLFCVPAYVVFANVFNVGTSYTANYTNGYLDTSRMYIVPILIFIGFYYMMVNKNTKLPFKLLDVGLISLNIIILLVTTRRTSLGMLLGALLVFMIFNRQIIFKMVFILLFLIGALIVSYPLYETRLTEQLEKRERIQNFDTYENEGRFLETLYLVHYHKQQQKPLELIFGVQLFDTLDFTMQYFGYFRSIHSDINMILYSTGIVGFLLFVVFFFHYLFSANGKLKPANPILFFPLLIMFLIVLVPGRFIGTFTFGPLLMLLLSVTKYGRGLPQKKPRKIIQKTRLMHA